LETRAERDQMNDLRPHPDVSWRRLEDEIVIVHLKTNRIYRLNRTAARFWELLAEGSDRAAAERMLAAEFDVDADALRQETTGLLNELSSEGLLD
jgi:hypothetical protein